MAGIHGGQIIARALKAEGVDALFTLTGGHIVPILDGCVQEGIRIVDVRHEQTAAHAAEAYTRLTGRLGVAAVTAGPGVTDTITALAAAQFSGTPMLLLGGRHFIRQEQRGGLQEMDHPQLVRPVTRWAATAWETGRLADYIATAARHAFAGRGGPVFLDVPLDVQADMVAEDSVEWPENYRPTEPVGADEAVVERVAELLLRAARPVVFVGGGLRPQSAASLLPFAEALGTMVYLNGAARGALPYGHGLLGNRTRSEAFREADLVLALGVDWDFRTGYGSKINEEATVVQVDAEPTKIGWNRAAHMGIVADPAQFLDQLGAHKATYGRSKIAGWTNRLQSSEAEQLASANALAESGDPAAALHPELFGREVAAFFGPDAIVAVDGGDIVSTTAKWLQVSHPGHVLDPGPFGTLGTGPGYALAAKVVHPEKEVGIVFGDGGFGFHGMEYDTFLRHELAVIGVVGNDGVWNNIKTFHSAFYPDRLVATDLGVRPYHNMVAGLGGHGSFVRKASKLVEALEEARAAGTAALVNVHLLETFRASSNYAQ
jgi:acetolactate synthase-1/2/3 large subunit